MFRDLNDIKSFQKLWLMSLVDSITIEILYNQSHTQGMLNSREASYF